jgi:hypothetical protein
MILYLTGLLATITFIVVLVSLPGWLMNNELKKINKMIKQELIKHELNKSE